VNFANNWIAHVGWIVLLSALWFLGARLLNCDNANVFEAVTFGILVFLSFRTAH
jgi:hypothetical protein